MLVEQAVTVPGEVIGAAATIVVAVGGLLLRKYAAGRTEKGKRAYQARESLRDTLERYRRELEHDHDQLWVLHRYPDSYVSLAGQEQLAEDVLRELPHLRRGVQSNLRHMLTAIVGAVTVNFSESRVHIPVERRDQEQEKNRLALALRRLNTDPDYARVFGLLGMMNATQNDRGEHDIHYEKAMAILSDMIYVAKP